MSTTNTQQQTGTFNQAGMGAYNQLTPAFANAATGYLNNPFGNPFFQQQQQMGVNQANLMGQTATSNITRNMSLSGMSGSNNPALLEMLNNQSRQNSSNRANLGFLNPVQNAFTAQQNAMGMAGNYRPLQTGQTTTQKQSGLGSWLPQVAGMGLSLATGGMSGMFGGAAGSASPFMTGTMGAMQSAMSPMQGGQGSMFGPSGGMGYGAPDVGGYNFGQSPFMMQGQP